MPKKIVIAAAVVFLSIVAVLAAYKLAERTSSMTEEKNSASTNGVGGGATLSGYEDPEKIQIVIDEFISVYKKSVPLDSDPKSADLAASFFSEGGRAQIPITDQGYNFASLLGVQDVPQSYRVSGINYSRNPDTGDLSGLAFASVELELSGKTVVREFVMSKTADGKWLIDDVRESEQKAEESADTQESTQSVENADETVLDQPAVQ